MTTSSVERLTRAEYPSVVSPAEWLAARQALLAKEKELTRYRDMGHLAHLHARDTSLVLVSRAPLGKIEPFRRRMGWTIPWYSSFGSGFNYDFHVTMDEAVAPVEYNYRTKAELARRGETYFTQGESHGLSVFLRDGDRVFHTYSTYARGADLLAGTYNYLDLTPMGRQEDWEEPPGRSNSSFLAWVRHHDRYEDSARAAASCCRSGENHPEP